MAETYRTFMKKNFKKFFKSEGSAPAAMRAIGAAWKKKKAEK